MNRFFLGIASLAILSILATSGRCSDRTAHSCAHADSACQAPAACVATPAPPARTTVTLRAAVDTLTVPTRNLTSPMRVTVAVPASYLDPADTASYPVTYVLNGFGGGYKDFAQRMRLDSLATLYSTIIVCPDGRDSWYWDAPMDSTMKMETFFTADLVPFIDRSLRTKPCRSQRAITGLSMGGQGAMYLAIRHDDIWANAGTMSGGVNIANPKFHNSWKMKRWLGEYSKYPSRWRDRAIVNLAKSVKPGSLQIIVSCGTEDFFFADNRKLDSVLTAAGIEHTFLTRPGNHSWSYWTTELPVHLRFFSEKFQSAPACCKK